MVAEQHVRPVTTTRESYKLENIVEEVPIRTTTMERYVEQVPVRKRIAKRVPYVTTVNVPRRVTTRVPLSYYDPFSAAIAADYSTFSNVLDSSVTTASASSPISSAPSASNQDSTRYKPEVQSIDRSSTEDAAEALPPAKKASGDLDLDLN